MSVTQERREGAATAPNPVIPVKRGGVVVVVVVVVESIRDQLQDLDGSSYLCYPDRVARLGAT